MSDKLIIETSLDTFEHDVLTASHEKPILVDFWAEWCPPCVVVAPLLEQVVTTSEFHVFTFINFQFDEHNLAIPFIHHLFQ